MRLRQHESVKTNRMNREGFFRWVSRTASKKRVAFVALLGIAFLCSGLFCFWPTVKTPPVVHAEIGATYADPATCTGCHADVAKTYRETGMGRSFHRVNASDSLKDFATSNTLYNEASGRYYTMIDRDGKLYEQRHQIGFDHKETNFEEMQIDYVVGSGNHSHTYLHRTAEGKLVELPVSWYSEMGGSWAMSPGYDRADQEDFRRAIKYECMACHNGYPAPDQIKNNADENIFGDKLPEGIDCQRCHGPGSAHVRAASTEGTSPEAIRAAIVNPATLTRDRQMDVCMQCHLETGISLRVSHAIPDSTAAPFSYRPGKPLESNQLFFDHKPGTGNDDRMDVAQQAYRLKKSACFLKSEMTCTTCHNPHLALRGEEATKHFVAVCNGCHANVHPALVKPAGADCLTCHMWKRRTDDAVHVVLTDHYIQRIKPKKDFLAPLKEILPGDRNQVVPYPLHSAPQRTDAELYLAVAQADRPSDLEAAALQLKRVIESTKPPEAEFYFALAAAYAKGGKNADAIHWYEETLRHRADYPVAQRGLATTLAAAGDLKRAAEVGEKAAASPHPDTTVLTNLGNVYLQQGRVADAGRVLEQALAINPDLPDATVFLGLVRMNEGNVPAAETLFRAALNMQPEYAEAHNDLAIILGARGAYPEAAFHLKQAVEANPTDVQIRRNYVMALVHSDSFDQAIVETKEGLRLNPRSAPLHLDLGKLLAKRGDASQAEQEFREAIVQNDSYGEAHLRLADLLARKGQLDEARQHYQKAAEDPNPKIRQAALDALSR
jgi:tetratricopeptide (TPR) repeat protein